MSGLFLMLSPLCLGYFGEKEIKKKNKSNVVVFSCLFREWCYKCSVARNGLLAGQRALLKSSALCREQGNIWDAQPESERKRNGTRPIGEIKNHLTGAK